MYLEQIKSPKDIKKLNISELNCLCDEIRKKLIQTVSKNGGHLASNLGVVELTVAMHYVFDCPNDSFLFDVGHQCYTHKLLTKRQDRFDTIRKEGGLSGFMNPSESEYDAFISGHSSNSFSAACGIAKANTMLKNDNYVVDVIGDGAMTGGMFFEAFNNAGNSNDKLIVIINDNEMSISKNVGSLHQYLNNIRSSTDYIKSKNIVKHKLNKIPVIGKSAEQLISKSKNLLKRVVYYGDMFESMGYVSFGPIDGHDLEHLIDTLNAAKEYNRPVIIHTCTVKGKGYDFAEEHPNDYHGVGSFDVSKGYVANYDGFSNEFGKKLVMLAQKDKKICAITAAMAEGTGLVEFREKFKNRFFDVGIAEQHAVTFACGLASKGYKPVFAVYSSFLQRSYDQLIHDAAITDYNITFAIDRAGIVGADGVTHQGIFDVAYLNTIPNICVYSPAYYDEFGIMLEKSISYNGVSAVRYPRGKEQYRPEWYEYHGEDYFIKNNNSDSIAITFGIEFSVVSKALEDKCVNICKVNKIKPIPAKLISDLMGFKNIVIFEEGIKNGGFAELLISQLVENGYSGKISVNAIEDFVPHMSYESALAKYNLDKTSVLNRFNGEYNE